MTLFEKPIGVLKLSQEPVKKSSNHAVVNFPELNPPPGQVEFRDSQFEEAPPTTIEEQKVSEEEEIEDDDGEEYEMKVEEDLDERPSGEEFKISELQESYVKLEDVRQVIINSIESDQSAQNPSVEIQEIESRCVGSSSSSSSSSLMTRQSNLSSKDKRKFKGKPTAANLGTLANEKSLLKRFKVNKKAKFEDIGKILLPALNSDHSGEDIYKFIDDKARSEGQISCTKCNEFYATFKYNPRLA